MLPTGVDISTHETTIFDDVRSEVTQKLEPDERLPMNRYFDGSPDLSRALCPGFQPLIHPAARGIASGGGGAAPRPHGLAL